MNETEATLDRVAIIGMAGRFPGAADLDAYWRNLESGVESIRALSEEELLAAGLDPDVLLDPDYVRASPVLDGYDRFDAGFFGMTPREAAITDPQTRLFLELAVRALEDAGYDPARYPGDVGVYGGTGGNLYAWLNLRTHAELVGDGGTNLTLGTASGIDYLCTSVSYRLGLRGPSLTVQTACSTSLVALHLACESIRGGESDLALAGGVSIELPHVRGYHYSEGGVESPDGHCRTFDAAAHGTVWGSGGGIVVLKRLDAALADGDRVQAVILSTAINNDGATKVGFSAPSTPGQAEVVAEALALSGVDPRTISYVEAHGTGTALGDPIEVAALTEVFRRFTDERGFCTLGSVKPNIGHLGQASGVAGLIKTVLAMRHRRIPPTLHYERPNPQMDLDRSPFTVRAALSVWEAPPGTPLRAGVSSFGIGGTNAHVVVEEPPERAPSGPSRARQLVLLSARRPAQLDELTDQVAAHLGEHPEEPLADVAHTLRVGRSEQPHRRALVAADAAEAADILARRGRRLVTAAEPARSRQVAFLFPGQGAQYPDMTRGLWEDEAAYREVLDRCAEVLRPELGLDLRDLLFPAPGEEEAAARRLEQTAITQPALFAVEYALARLWMSWGVQPRALLGHSVGEYVAACVAGVFDLETSLRLVAARGRMMQDQPPGVMLAVQAAAGVLEPMLPAGTGVAALNGPSLTVAAGPADAIAELEAALRRAHIGSSRLRTSHAFHSPMMDPVLEGFGALVDAAAPRAPSIPVVSNLTGTWLRADEARDGAYWAAHLRRAVRFADGVRELLAEPDRVFVEVGPGRTLAGLVRLQGGRGVHTLQSVRGAKEPGTDLEALLGAVGRLWTLGGAVDWTRFSADERRRRVKLPGVPMDRQRHWIDPVPAGRTEARPNRRGRRLPLDSWFSLATWRERPAPAGRPVAPPGPVLVMADQHGLGAALAGKLRALGLTVAEARPGGCFAAEGDLRYRMDPARAADFEALLEALHQAGAAPATIVHAWPVAPAPPDLALAPEDLAAGRRLGFYALLHLAQALAASQSRGQIGLVAVTSDALSVAPGDGRRPAGALVGGPCRVLPAELPGLRCRHVDVRLPEAGGRPWERLLDQLLAELTAGDAGEVVLRAGQRWMRAFEPLRLPAPEGKAGLRARGVYLITGGLGGVGLALARDLARRCRARLVLTARTALPDRGSWDAWLDEHGRDDPTSRRLLAVRELEAAGSEVLVLRADAADRAQMSAARACLLERFGGLDGIVHAAGTAGGGMAEVKTVEQAEAVLAPKVEGAVNLGAVFADLEPDFVSLCSSVTAVAGGFGQVDYCAANAFMDALAGAGGFGSSEACSVDWSGWRDAGMAAETAAPAAFRELQGGVRWERFDHPLLDRVERSGDRVVVAGMVSPETTWALGEHRVAGVPVLPGTTYLELARAGFVAAHGPGPIEVRDLEFLLPLAVPEGQHRELRLVLEPAGAATEFRAMSAPAGGAWQEHARGIMVRPPEALDRWHDPAAIAGRCPTALEPPARDGLTTLVAVGPRWASAGRTLAGRGEALTELEAPEPVAAELATLPLHPALLDVATAFASGWAIETGSHLPVGYGSVTMRAPLASRMRSHVRVREHTADGDLTCDVTLMDEHGAELVDIRGFALRRVDGGAVGAMLATGAAATGDEAPAGGAGIGLDEGAEAFARLVAWRPGPQVVVSTTDLDAVLEEVGRLTQETLEEGLAGVRLVADAERDVSTPYVAPRSDVERALVEVWAGTLGTAGIGVDDDFFELGGNSLVAVQMISLVRDRLGVRLPVRTLFRDSTIAGMARAVEEARRGRHDRQMPELVRLPRNE